MDLCEGREGGEGKAYWNTAIATETVDYEGVALLGHGCFDDSTSVTASSVRTCAAAAAGYVLDAERECSDLVLISSVFSRLA